MLSQLADSAGLVEELSQTKAQVKVHCPTDAVLSSRVLHTVSSTASHPSPLQSLEDEVSQLKVALGAAHTQQRETEAILLATVRSSQYVLIEILTVTTATLGSPTARRAG